MSKSDNVVTHCPLRGHRPLCSDAECQEASKTDYADCKRILGITGLNEPVCGVTEIPCSKCKPGACGSRKTVVRG